LSIKQDEREEEEMLYINNLGSSSGPSRRSRERSAGLPSRRVRQRHHAQDEREVVEEESEETKGNNMMTDSMAAGAMNSEGTSDTKASL